MVAIIANLTTSRRTALRAPFGAFSASPNVLKIACFADLAFGSVNRATLAVRVTTEHTSIV